MGKVFKTTEELNSFVLQGKTPLEYCKSVLKDIITMLTVYVNGDRDADDLDPADFFWDRQCEIHLKNRTAFQWTIETPLEAIIIPNLDDVEYVLIHGVPAKLTKAEAAKLGIYKKDIENHHHNGFFHLNEYLNSRAEYKIDSIHGVFAVDDDYGKTVHRNYFHTRDYRLVERWYPEYQVSLHITDRGFGGTYFAGVMDGYIGALIAEQILLSNDPQDASLKYGTQEYQSIVVFASPPTESTHSICNHAFLDDALSYCSRLLDSLDLDAQEHSVCGSNRAQAIAYAKFVYMYIHSLLRTAPAENFSIIEPVFIKHLKQISEDVFWDAKGMISDIRKICRTNYYKKPQFAFPKSFAEHFSVAVWAVVNCDSYLSALKNILELVQYRHDAQLAVTLTGIFAGIYYQHYRIPQDFLVNNRYYGRFSASIIPLDHEAYKEKQVITAELKNHYL